MAMQQQHVTRAVKPTSIKLPGALKDRIYNIAALRQRSAHTIMIQALQSFVEKEEKREALRREYIAAHEHYKATGLHLTQEEVEAWMLELEAGNDVEPPACHI
jgi:predicted transcriptional regulator